MNADELLPPGVQVGLLKRAQIETVIDCLELLIKLRDGAARDEKQINDMINRMTNMAKSL